MITFSSDAGNLKRADLEITAKMAEEYFGTEADPGQMPTTKEVRDWVTTAIPEYLNVIRDGQEVIGYAFMLPSTRTLMEEFVAKRINERTLYESIRKLKNHRNPEAIYLCAAFVKKEYRRRGLCATAFVKGIKNIAQNGRIKPILFSWPFTDEGKKVSERVAKKLNLSLRVRAG